MFEVIQEVMHQIGLLPLGLMVLLLRSRSFGTVHWLVASALALSWIADSATSYFMQRGYEPMAVMMQLLMPVQILMVLVAVVKPPTTVFVLGLGLVLMTVVSALQGREIYELVIPVVGGTVVAWYAWRAQLGLLSRGLMVYFGVGALAWMLLALAATALPTLALWGWYGYQLSRLTGLLMIGWVVVSARQRGPRMVYVA